MSTRGRDLRVAIVSDLQRFDLSDAARDLDDLGDAAKGAGRDVERGLDDAAGSMDDLSDKADKTRRDLNQFLDKLGDNAKRAGRETRAGMKDAQQGMDDLKSEAGQSGREAAASFSGGFDDVQDFIQETAANAFTGFGPAGAAAGLAAAAGIGLVTNEIQKINEQVDEVRENFERLGTDTPFDVATANLETFKVKIQDMKADAEKLGVSMDTMWKFYAGDPAAVDEVRRKAKAFVDGQGAINTALQTGDTVGRMYLNRSGLITEQHRLGAESATERTRAEQLLNAETQRSAENADVLAKALRNVDEEAHNANVASLTGALREVGDVSGEMATKVDKNGRITIRAILDVLKEQTEATINHQKNLQTALTEGGEAFAAWMAEQPAAVAQAYVKGSAKERKAIREAAAKNVGAQMGQGTAEGLTGSAPAISTAANTIYNTAKSKLTGRPILIPVGVDGPTVAQVDAVYRQIRKRFGTIEIPVVPKQFGQGRFIPGP